MSLNWNRLLPVAALFGLALPAVPALAVQTSDFVIIPIAAGLNGAPFIADTMKLSDYGAISVNPTNGVFTESGYLPVIGFSLNGTTINPPGFDSANGNGWGEYIKYQSTGVEQLTATGLVVTYSALSFKLYGYNGLAAFGINASGSAYESGGRNVTILGSGSLTDGTLTLVPTAFTNGEPSAFQVNGTIQTSLATTNPLFMLASDNGLNINIDHLPGELFPTSATTFIADGGTSSTATLIPGGWLSGLFDNGAAVLSDTSAPEPASALILAAGLVPMLGLRRRRT